MSGAEHNMRDSRPERWALTVIRKMLPDAEAGFIEGDLLEVYAQRQRHGRRRALLWLWMQAPIAVLRYWLARMFPAGRSVSSCRDAQPPHRRRPRRLAGFLDAIALDLRQSLRSLSGSPPTTLVVVLTLAVSIGLTMLAFSVAHAIGFPKLPYDDDGRLVEIGAVTNDRGSGMSREHDFSMPLFEVVRDGASSFDGVAGFVERSFTLSDDDGAISTLGASVTPELFRVLRVQPARGRTFSAVEAATAADEVVVISHRLWVQHFGSDPEILGRTVVVDAVPRAIIGVMPEGFHFYKGPLLWTPLAGEELHDARVIGRLAAGVTSERANADVGSLSDILVPSPGLRPAHLATRPLGSERIFLRWTAFFAVVPVGFVLLIACTNVAGLLLARTARRRAEMAVRAALGGGRARLMRQLLTESLTLTAAGVVVGLWVARFAAGALTRFTDGLLLRDSLLAFHLGAYGSPLPAELLRFDLDPAVVAFAVCAAAFVMVAIGLAPALELSRPDLDQALRVGGFGATGGRRARRWQRLLATSQMALSVVVLVGAGLTWRSLVELRHFDPGFDVDHVVQVELQFPAVGYPETRRAQLVERAMGRFQEAPGVEAVAASWNADWEQVRGIARPVDLNPWRAYSSIIGPGYFSTLGIAVLRGREFTENDDRSAQRVAVVNETAARRWPGEDPIGEVVHMRKRGGEEPYLIVGVVADIADPLDANPFTGQAAQAPPEVYVAGLQVGADVRRIYVRTSAAADRMVETLRTAVWTVDPNLPVGAAPWMGEDDMALAVLVVRWIGRVASILAMVALVVAAAGIYTVIAYQVAQRGREIGVRMALGAAVRDIRKLVLHDGLALASFGIAIGLLGSIALAGQLGFLLFGAPAFDPWTFAGVALLLTVATLLASWLPARRAARVDPAVTLRQD